MSERRTETVALASLAIDCDAGLTAFFIQSEVIRRGHRELVMRSIVEKGFEILLEFEVAGDAQALLSDWLTTRLPSVDAAEVATIFIAHDLMPITSSEPENETPVCENERTRIATAAAEKEVIRVNGPGRSYIPVRASEAGADAWSLLDTLVPDRIQEIREQIAAREAAFATPPPLRELSSVACRAKVQLVEYKGSVAVRKTFRPGAERYLERELAVLRELGPDCEAIPGLLEHGPNYLVMEYVDELDQLGLPRREELLPLPLIRELAQFVRTCVAHGFDPVDLKPDGNAIFTRYGLKVIDYEFWRRCPADTRAEDCYCLAGLPQEYDGDRPMGLAAPFRPYPTKWIPFTGLSVHSFLYDPRWLQRLKRCVWPATWAFRRAARFVARRIRSARTAPRNA